MSVDLSLTTAEVRVAVRAGVVPTAAEWSRMDAVARDVWAAEADRVHAMRCLVLASCLGGDASSVLASVDPEAGIDAALASLANEVGR